MRYLTKTVILSAITAVSLFGESELQTHTELSYMNSAGNTEAQTLSLKSELLKEFSAKDSAKGKVTALYAEDGAGDATANNHYLEGEYDRKFTEKLFGYVKGNYSKDKFSGYKYRYNVGPGVGYSIKLPNPDHKLEVSAGIMYSEDKFEAGNSSDYQSGELGAKFGWKIAQGLKFKEDVLYRTDMSDTENYTLNSVTALENKISDILSLGVSYSLLYNNLAPEGTEDTDKIFLLSLIIDY
jgi:putative salt-induced outer membrane protein